MFTVSAAPTTLSCRAEEAPPPGDGLATAKLKWPSTPSSAAGRMAVNCVADTKAVVRELLLKLTVEALVNPLPVTVRVVSEEFTSTWAGVTEDKVGAGYDSDTDAEPDLVVSA